MWNYLWGYTAAQIELMAVDAPMVVYTEGKERKPSKEELAATADKWEKKYKGKSKKVDLSELLKGKEWQS